MDAQAKKKAFRAKLNARKLEKQRIDSPLIRYNEHDQPVCRVCDVVIKSELHWPGHQASRKHHEAIEKLKANAAALNRPNNVMSESATEFPKPTPESTRELNNESSEPSIPLPKRQSSTLPPDFFDNQETKRQKNDGNSGKFRDPNSLKKDSVTTKTRVLEAFISDNGTDKSSATTSSQKENTDVEASETVSGSGSKQVQGVLPAGFFDDKDADLRARGITPVKPDVKDEYKEFEKLIQGDLQEVDNRMEEEEFDAAEMIEEEETVEQRTYIEKLEMLRKKKLEFRASKSAASAKVTKVTHKESSREDSSSDDDDDSENFKVDWRAKHL